MNNPVRKTAGLSASEEKRLFHEIKDAREVLRQVLLSYPDVWRDFVKTAPVSYFVVPSERFRNKRRPSPTYFKDLSVFGENNLFDFVASHKSVDEITQTKVKEAKKHLLDATQGFVSCNYPLIHFVFSKYIGKQRFEGEFQEYLGAGVEGLIIAARKYDLHRKTRFSTMAEVWIKKYVLAHVSEVYKAQRERSVGGEPRIFWNIYSYYRRKPNVTAKELRDKFRVSLKTAEHLLERIEHYPPSGEKLTSCSSGGLYSDGPDDEVMLEETTQDESRDERIDDRVQVRVLLDQMPIQLAARLRATYLPTALREEIITCLPTLAEALVKARNLLKIVVNKEGEE